jgi:FixJ family two-component response regulator
MFDTKAEEEEVMGHFNRTIAQQLEATSLCGMAHSYRHHSMRRWQYKMAMITCHDDEVTVNLLW